MNHYDQPIMMPDYQAFTWRAKFAQNRVPGLLF